MCAPRGRRRTIPNSDHRLKTSKSNKLDIFAHICALTAPGLASAMRMIKFFGEKLGQNTA
jgi:hypothetical protein